MVHSTAQTASTRGELCRETSLDGSELRRHGTRSDRTHNDDISLFGIKDGRHDWYYCEHLQLVSVDVRAKTITVKRGCYGSRPLAFQKGKSRAAAHQVEGPWGANNHFLWYHGGICRAAGTLFRFPHVVTPLRPCLRLSAASLRLPEAASRSGLTQAAMAYFRPTSRCHAGSIQSPTPRPAVRRAAATARAVGGQLWPGAGTEGKSSPLPANGHAGRWQPPVPHRGRTRVNDAGTQQSIRIHVRSDRSERGTVLLVG